MSKQSRFQLLLTALIAVSILSARPASANDAVLAIAGTCPGQVRISWSNAFPNRGCGLVWGLERGKTNIPNGFPCSGTVMGVYRSVREIHRFRTRLTGSGHLIGQANAKFCGGVVQMVVFDVGPCQLSNVVDVPR